MSEKLLSIQFSIGKIPRCIKILRSLLIYPHDTNTLAFSLENAVQRSQDSSPSSETTGSLVRTIR